jgi:hypothetical protein
MSYDEVEIPFNYTEPRDVYSGRKTATRRTERYMGWDEDACRGSRLQHRGLTHHRGLQPEAGRELSRTGQPLLRPPPGGTDDALDSLALSALPLTDEKKVDAETWNQWAKLVGPIDEVADGEYTEAKEASPFSA